MSATRIACVGVMLTPNFMKMGCKFQIFSGVAQNNLLTSPRKEGSLTAM